MATLIQDIRSRDWQISTAGVGIIAEGLQDIRQCLDIILRTTKGSDPLRPEFGSDLFQHIDKPLNAAIPNCKKAIIEAVSIWERRVSLNTVNHAVDGLNTVDFFVAYSLQDSELMDMLKLQLSNGTITIDEAVNGNLIVNAFFPPNPNSKRYQISLIIDDEAALPATPSAGFQSITDMYQWMVANWSGIGQWLLGADRIVGYLPVNRIESASIEVSLTGTLKFSATVPDIADGKLFSIAFAPDGSDLNASGIQNLEQLLLYVRSNWADYGDWQIEGTQAVTGEFDDTDFAIDEFDIGIAPAYVLVLYSEKVNQASLEVTIN